MQPFKRGDRGQLIPKSSLRKRGLDLQSRKNLFGYLFTLPVLLGMVLIFLPALYKSFVYSLSEINIRLDYVQVDPVGFKNYIEATTVDVEFRVFLFNALSRTVTDTVAIIIFSFFIATVLNQDFRGRGFARTIFFLPVLLSTGIVAAADTNSMMMSVFGSSSNTSSTISTAFTSTGFDFLFSFRDLLESMNLAPTVTNFILNTVDNTYNVVNSSGVQILIFLSALQSISPSVFEAARVEGATRWEEFWKITFPMITPMILVNIIYTIVDSFSSPQYGMLGYIREVAFTDNKIGLASAFSWIYFVIVLLILGLVTAVISRRIQYLD